MSRYEKMRWMQVVEKKKEVIETIHSDMKKEVKLKDWIKYLKVRGDSLKTQFKIWG